MLATVSTRLCKRERGSTFARVLLQFLSEDPNFSPSFLTTSLWIMFTVLIRV